MTGVGRNHLFLGQGTESLTLVAELQLPCSLLLRLDKHRDRPAGPCGPRARSQPLLHRVEAPRAAGRSLAISPLLTGPWDARRWPAQGARSQRVPTASVCPQPARAHRPGQASSHHTFSKSCSCKAKASSLLSMTEAAATSSGVEPCMPVGTQRVRVGFGVERCLPTYF